MSHPNDHIIHEDIFPKNYSASYRKTLDYQNDFRFPLSMVGLSLRYDAPLSE
jgi:hypothetical protein